MDKYTVLKEKLRQRQLVTMGNVMLLQSPFMLNAFLDADCILLDKEHGLYGTEELIPLTNQCRHIGLPAVIRVEDAQYHLIAKAIDIGADGIMLPRTETLKQLKTAVDAMHFAPVGRTGFGGWGLLRDGETIDEFQQDRILIVQIESHQGLITMEDMISQYGQYIDAFVIGPNDYSIMMGIPRQLDHPVMLEEYRKFFDICKKHNKSCGIFDPDLEHAVQHHKMGANVFWLSDDFSCLKSGFNSLLNGLEAAIGS